MIPGISASVAADIPTAVAPSPTGTGSSRIILNVLCDDESLSMVTRSVKHGSFPLSACITDVRAMAASPDGRFIVIVDQDAKLFLVDWPPHDDVMAWPVRLGVTPVSAAAASVDGAAAQSNPRPLRQCACGSAVVFPPDSRRTHDGAYTHCTIHTPWTTSSITLADTSREGHTSTNPPRVPELHNSPHTKQEERKDCILINHSNTAHNPS